MKIYTKKGDTGNTLLVGGKQISKTSPLLEAYGTVDELNAAIGMIIADFPSPFLTDIQQQLFIIGGLLATEPHLRDKYWQNVDIPTYVSIMENEIDQLSAELEPLKQFLLPQGSRVIAQCHVSRTICRRLERRICEICQEEKNGLSILQYVNRLSDYFFILARYLHKNNNVEEIHCKSIR
jgi:cob(I)alamin adenosyltransferase